MYLNPAYVRSARFDLRDKNRFFIFCYLTDESSPEAAFDGASLSVSASEWEEKYSVKISSKEDRELKGTLIEIQLPENRRADGRLIVKSSVKGAEEKLVEITEKEFKRFARCPQYFIEKIAKDKEEGLVRISGWIAAPDIPQVKAYGRNGNELKVSVDHFMRSDVNYAFPETDIFRNSGTHIDIYDGGEKNIRLVFSCGEYESEAQISTGGVFAGFKKLKDYGSRGYNFVKRNGIKALPGKIRSKMNHTDGPPDYEEWYKHNSPTKEELRLQREAVFDYAPKISVVVPLYKTPENFLKKLVDSVRNQTYSNWELCLSDGSGEDSPIAALLEKYAAEDERIVIIPADHQRRIVENTNCAIEKAAGDYIAFADHDDELTPNAFYEVVKALNADKELEMIYSDEDKINASGTRLSEPQMKPEFNRELLRTVNYICHLLVVKKTLLDRCGYLRPEYEGAQDYDLVLRLSEMTRKIKRIPHILYHWRLHAESTSAAPEAKDYAFEAGLRAVQAHYERCGIKAVVSHGEYKGLYRTKFIRDHDPLISIMIPNKDHIDDLKTCVDALEKRSTYRNFEVIVIENNSTEEETFEYYKALEAQYDNVRVVYYEGGFNFSLINNFGERYAKGEYLLLLNNDTELINDDVLEELLGYCMLPDVGAVGARLYYEDDTVQHAGVVMGFGGIAGHCFVQMPRAQSGYCHRAICAQDYSAVTAACVMVKHSAYNEVGQMSDYLAVAFNDIDFCMKLREAGYLIVYNPYAEMHHYESKSRGYEDTPEKVERFNREIDAFAAHWPKILEEGDPYYNPNLTLDSQDFSLKRNW